MNTAQPIKDTRLIEELLDVYPVNSKPRTLLAFALNTGLRISDILQTTVSMAKKGMWIGKEKKTGKSKRLQFPANLRVLLIDYIEEQGLTNDDYLFFNDKDRSKAITRQAGDKVIRHAGDMIGITLSAHSLRKTFGYMAYKSKQYDLAELQYLFNHSSSQTTLRYIGITEESINDKMKSFSIGI